MPVLVPAPYIEKRKAVPCSLSSRRGIGPRCCSGYRPECRPEWRSGCRVFLPRTDRHTSDSTPLSIARRFRACLSRMLLPLPLLPRAYLDTKLPTAPRRAGTGHWSVGAGAEWGRWSQASACPCADAWTAVSQCLQESLSLPSLERPMENRERFSASSQRSPRPLPNDFCVTKRRASAESRSPSQQKARPPGEHIVKEASPAARVREDGNSSSSVSFPDIELLAGGSTARVALFHAQDNLRTELEVLQEKDRSFSCIELPGEARICSQGAPPGRTALSRRHPARGDSDSGRVQRHVSGQVSQNLPKPRYWQTDGKEKRPGTGPGTDSRTQSHACVQSRART